jgi:hypothetical protein
VWLHGELFMTASFQVEGALVRAIYGVRNPDKLAAVDPPGPLI